MIGRRSFGGLGVVQKRCFLGNSAAHWPCPGVRGWLGRCWDNPFQLRWNRLYPSMSSQCGSG